MYHLTLKGNPFERGLQHGEELRGPIHELAQIRRELLSKFLVNMSPWEQEKLAMTQVESLFADSDLFDEFQGIAKGAAIGLTDLAILNNYTDMRDFDPPQDGGCSVFGIIKDGRGLCGQTWDMHASAAPFMTVMKLLNQNGDHEAWVLTVCGGLGLAGMNAKGVSVLINNLHCREVNPKGIIWNALVRKALKADSAKDAFDVLKNNLPSSGHNYLFADRSQLINIETTGQAWDVVEEVNGSGVSFHTNHYLGKLKKHEIEQRKSKTSIKRYDNLVQLFGQVDLDKFEFDLDSFERKFFSDGQDCSICIPRPSDPHGPMTCGGIIFDLDVAGSSNLHGRAFAGLYEDNNHLDLSSK